MLMTHQDRAASRVKLSRAMELWDGLNSREKSDWHFSKVLHKLLGDVLVLLSHDDEWSAKAMIWIESLSRLGVVDETRVYGLPGAIRRTQDSQIGSRLQKASEIWRARGGDGVEADSDDVFQGWVTMIDHDRGFGFIACRGEEYYFNRYQFVGDGVSWANLLVDRAVEFRIGRNKLGVCAVGVFCIEDE